MAQNPNIDDAARARAMKFVSDKAAPAKPRVVGKKELEDSGLSLRDFLNKERGLTRRKERADPTAGEAKDKAAQTAADTIDPGAPQPPKYIPTSRTTQPLSDVTRPGTRVPYDNTDTSDMTFKKGGKVQKMASGGSVSSASKRADGCAVKGKTRGKMI